VIVSLARFTAIPASDTITSPRTNLRYFRGLTGTGLAAPNMNPAWDTHRITGSSTVMNGSMCLRGFKVSRPSM